jgi:hypothetical protein
MATVTLQYDAHNGIAQKFLDLLKSIDVFEIVEEKPLYNPEFVKKIKSQEGKKSVAINTADLWK